jgi:hypothetical protein
MISNQLAENTGAHMMDSGGARGRAWQRNQDAAAAHGMTVLEMFKAGSPAFWDGYGVTVSTFHWMSERLDYRADLDERFHRWINLGWIGLDRYARGPETNHPGTVDDYVERMTERGWIDEDHEFTGWTNTYNHENCLSQDLQFRIVGLNEHHPLGPASIVFMSTHNGADARGGYSDFHIYECDEWEMFDWCNFSAYCPECETLAADPADTIFDERPYVRESSGIWWHQGEWSDPDGSCVAGDSAPIFDPRWPKPGIDLPDDFEQTGPICPIHHCNMEVS